MVVTDTELLTFTQWFLYGNEEQYGALWWFLLVTLCLSLLGLVAGYLVAAVRNGPIAAGDMTYKVLTTGVRELFELSPRRVWALTRLAVQESVRRRVWVTLLVFFALLLFAPWFLGSESNDPVKIYVSFVMGWSMFLVLSLALFLSAFSLPNDIKNRTIYTIVTKPVRAGEIVLGRVLGFTLIGSLLLAGMGLSGYFFVVRSLNHTHEISPFELAEIPGEQGPVGKQGDTSRELFHRHEVVIDNDGVATIKSNMGHYHDVTVTETPSGPAYALSGPRDLFRARVPVYGKLRFYDRTGNEEKRGISVGNEWTYRSYIEGGSASSAAVWTFNDVRPERYPDGLPIDLNIRVFRSHKGEIEQGILGSLVFKNPETGRQSEIQTFRAKDFYIDSHLIPRELTDSDGKPVDLFDDLVSPDGQMEIWLQCLNRAQYFGAAQADCYLRAAEGRFDVNYLKGFAGIWVQMVMVICLGVLFSTFLSGPVAMVATLGSVALGFFTQMIFDLTVGDLPGGGPLEAMIRIATQMNVTVELELGVVTPIVQTLDAVALFFMSAVANLLPNFSRYGNGDWVASGFDIPQGIVLQNLVSCAAYVLGVLIAGYFFFRIREVAK